MNQVCLGIDISKKDFHVALLKGPQQKAFYKKFANTIRGFEELSIWLKAKDVLELHACMMTGNKIIQISSFHACTSCHV